MPVAPSSFHPPKERITSPASSRGERSFMSAPHQHDEGEEYRRHEEQEERHRRLVHLRVAIGIAVHPAFEGLQHALPESLRGPIAHGDSERRAALWFLAARLRPLSYTTNRRAPTHSRRTGGYTRRSN